MGAPMDRTRIDEGVRRMRFESLLDRHERGEITQAEAAEMLGVAERTIRRWRDRYEEEGEAGLADRRLGRPSPRRAPAAELERMLGLYRDKYADFTVKHFHEQLVTRHGYTLGYTVTKVHLHRAGLVRPARQRSAHRKKRPRRPLVGMLLHQDGSRHAWLEGHPPLDLIVTLDDATSEIYSMFLIEEEGTASSFRGLREVVERHGLFCAFYTDRGSHYFHTAKAGEKVSRTQLTQVGRALARLGIEHIAAYSPEARGRSERLFRTLQDRLPKELRLAGLTTVAAANVWLRETYMAAPARDGTDDARVGTEKRARGRTKKRTEIISASLEAEPIADRCATRLRRTIRKQKSEKTTSYKTRKIGRARTMPQERRAASRLSMIRPPLIPHRR